MVAAISDLRRLLEEAKPCLHEGRFVFASFPSAQYGDLASLKPVATIREIEGLTMILDQQKARDLGLNSERPYRLISLAVHSSLDAVGLSAAVAGILAKHDIPANLIAGFYHDHILVPVDLAEAAMNALCELAD